jgi:mannose-6-phosphate isomerase-like protein (cupin superfamily)
MADHTIVNLKEDVEDMAPKFGLSPGLESRFARKPLGLENSGVSYFKIAADFKQPFGHRHGEQEEVYVIVSGSARIRLEDEEHELRQWDVVRVPGHVTRALQGGPDGAEVLAFGAPNTENRDAEMVQDFWE